MVVQLGIYVCQDQEVKIDKSVNKLLAQEEEYGLKKLLH